MKAYLYAQTKHLHRFLSPKNPARFTVILSFLLILIVVSLTTFFISRGFFRFLFIYSLVSVPFALYIFQTTLLAIYIFAIGSYTFLIYNRLNSKENIIYKLSGVSTLNILYKSLFEAALIGSWPVFALVLPAITGFNAAFQTPSGKILIQLIGLVFFIILSLLPAALIVLGIGLIKSAYKYRKTMIYGVSILLALIGILSVKLLIPNNLIRIASNPDTDYVIKQLGELPISSAIFPSSQLSSIIVNGNSIVTMFFFCFVFLIIFKTISAKISNQVWQKFNEGIFIASPNQKLNKRKAINFPENLTIVFKDYLMLYRIPSQLTYILFILFTTIVYIVILAKTPPHTQVIPGYQEFLSFAILLIPAYIFLTLSMQIIFPSCRKDVESAFLYAGIKDKWNEIVAQKSIFNIILASIYTGIIVLVTNIFFKSEHIQKNLPGGYYFSITILLSTIIFIVGSSFTKYLKSEFKDHSTNMPGIFTTGISITVTAVFAFIYTFKTTDILDPLVITSIISPLSGYLIVKSAITKSDLI